MSFRLFWVIGLMCLTACGPYMDGLTPIIAQPKAQAARNVTSFGPSLSCMDTMFDQANRRTIRITSTQIPDQTNQVNVGSADMLINAVNQMNRRSRAYVFIDPEIVKASTGVLLDIEARDPKAKVQPVSPQFYIRGSISQLDDDVHSRTNSTTLENTNPSTNAGVSVTGIPTSSNRSIVTVDLHMVALPSRQVIPGASVSNSMVVTRRGIGNALTGRIAKTALGFAVQIDNMESTGQAVRNLLELGLIELLGQHSGLPYWDCLSLETVNARKNARSEKSHLARGQSSQLFEAQSLLIRLGRLNGPQTGVLDTKTRRALAVFQAEIGLIASGEPDFDTVRALKQRVPKPKPVLKTKPVTQTRTAPIRQPETQVRPPRTDGYQSISTFLN